MLTALGLCPDEELLYRHLVTLPSADVTEAAGATDLAPSEVQAVLHRLVEKGLVTRLGDSPHRFVAAPPIAALTARKVAEEQRLRRVAREVDDLDLVYRSVARQQHELADVLEIVHGEDGVRDRFLQLNSAATSEVLAFVRSGVLAVTSRENTAADEAVARGVRYRIVFESEVMKRSDFSVHLARERNQPDEFRIVPSLPTRLLIVDRRIGLVPLTGQGPMEREGALVIRPGSLLDALIALFEVTWATASTREQSQLTGS